MLECVPGRLDDFLVGAGVHHAAIDVADQADLFAADPFHFGHIDAALGIIKEVLETVDGQIDFTDYDVTGAVEGQADGYVDGVILLTNVNLPGIALPHWRICQAGLTALACALAGVSGWDPTYDDVFVPWTAISGSAGGDPHFAVNVSVHEFGHLLGFADLYDESGQSTDMPYTFMGGWYYDDTPPLPDAFSRYVIGWGNPVQIAVHNRNGLRKGKEDFGRGAAKWQ